MTFGICSPCSPGSFFALFFPFFFPPLDPSGVSELLVGPTLTSRPLPATMTALPDADGARLFAALLTDARAASFADASGPFAFFAFFDFLPWARRWSSRGVEVGMAAGTAQDKLSKHQSYGRTYVSAL